MQFILSNKQLSILFFSLLASVSTASAFTLPLEDDFHGEITVNGSVATFGSISSTTTPASTDFGNAQQTIRTAENATIKHTLTLLKLASPVDTYIATHQIDFKQNATLNSIEGFSISLPRGVGTRLSYGPADNTVYQEEDYINIPAVPGYSKAGRMLFGGIPFNNVWNEDGGLYVSVLAAKPDIFALPINVTATHILLSHSYTPDTTIGSQTQFNAGDSITLPPIMVGLHQGDYFAPLREYTKALEIHTGKNYIDVPLGNANATQAYWKTWGLDPNVTGDFTLDGIRDITDTLKDREISRIMLDYGWFVTEGVWDANEDPGFVDNAHLASFVAELNGLGFEVGLWYQPLQVDPNDDDFLADLFPYTIRNTNGTAYIDDDNQALLDPSKLAVRTLVSNQLAAFQAMGIDHVYLDSQEAQLAAPPNYDLTRPLDSHEGLTPLYDLIRNAGETLNMTIEICPDGRSQTLLNMPQAVTNIGDPKNDRQLRTEHRWLKAIQGSKAIIGTYVENFDDNPTSGSFLNIAGIGGNIQSLGTPITLQNTEWNTWIAFQNKHQLVTADYLPLYDIGFDYPEGHVLRRGNYTFYAFFAKTEGSDICSLADCIDAPVSSIESAENPNVNELVTLRGLQANTEYRVTSFPASSIDTLVTTNNNGDASIQLNFNKEILLVVLPEACVNEGCTENPPIRLTLEEPATGKTSAGIANLRGWAVGLAAIDRIALYIDGKYITDIPSGASRLDVADAYPHYPNSDKSGFSMAFAYSELSAGPHVALVKAYDVNGLTQEASASFNVARLDNPYIADPSTVSLQNAIAAIEGEKIIISDFLAEGINYSLQLQWQVATQQFDIVSVSRSAALSLQAPFLEKSIFNRSPISAAPIILHLEEPALGRTSSGIANLRGWAIGLEAIEKIELFIDGQYITNIPSGGSRLDVASIHPTYPNSNHSGFSMAFAYSKLLSGSHIVRVIAYDVNGLTQEVSTSFNVARLENSFISDPNAVSLENATVSIESDHIIISNLSAEDKTYSLRLRWQKATQQFEAESIVKN